MSTPQFGEDKNPLRSKIAKVVLAVLGVWFVIGVIASVFIPMLKDASSYSEDKARWARYNVGGSGLLVELPGEPKQTDLAIPEASRKLLRYATTYTYEHRGLNVAIAYTKAADGVALQPDRAAAGMIERLKNAEGVTEFQYKTASEPQLKPSFDGSFALQGKKYRFEGFATVQQANLWVVMATYDASSPAALAAARRCLDSVKKDQ